MINQHCFAFADHGDRDLFTKSQTVERALNAAIVQAKISEGFEEYLDIFDAFYADDVEVSSKTGKEPIRGKARVRSLLFNFLSPLHCDGRNRWSVDLHSGDSDSSRRCKRNAFRVDTRLGSASATCTLRWCTLRKWNGSRIVYERHYDHQQSGGPLLLDDFAAKPAGASRKPS